MLEGQLAFTHVGEAKLVDQGIADGPGMAGVELLVAGRDVGAETGNVGSGGLEVIEGLKIRIVSKVVVETEALVIVDVMIETQRDLILTVTTDRDGLVIGSKD